MIVGFLDLLGFSQLLDLSTEMAIDNVNSFNYVIKTRVIGHEKGIFTVRDETRAMA